MILKVMLKPWKSLLKTSDQGVMIFMNLTLEDFETSEREEIDESSGADDEPPLHRIKPYQASTSSRPKKAKKRLNWVRIYPPEPEKDVAPQFMPRHKPPK